MASVKKGHVTAPKSWNKHLKPEGKREFWKGERREAHADAHRRAAE